jgi:hypothetical protein
MSTLVGFMVGVRVVFGVVCSLLSFWSPRPSNNGIDLGKRGNRPTKKRISIILARRGTIALLVTPAVVELSVWIGLFG